MVKLLHPVSTRDAGDFQVKKNLDWNSRSSILFSLKSDHIENTAINTLYIFPCYVGRSLHINGLRVYSTFPSSGLLFIHYVKIRKQNAS
jgi:hypothetical protein